MAKIACILPQSHNCNIARQVARELGMDVHVEVGGPDTLPRAKELVSQGTDILISRGYFSYLLHQELDIPLVDVTMTAQEMGMLIVQAQSMLEGVTRPTIGIVGYQAMFCDMSYFHLIYDVKLKMYTFSTNDPPSMSMRAQVEQAIADKVDLIIGGDIALECAQRAGIPSLYFHTTEDSIRVAFKEARNVAYAADMEKKNTAELKTLLDYSFDVIVKLNERGEVVIINHLAETLLGWDSKKVIGKKLTDVTKAVSPEILETVLGQGKEVYSTFIRVNDSSFVANFAPVLADSTVTGAIFSCQEANRLEQLGEAARREIYRQGHVARHQFRMLGHPSGPMRRAVELSKMYAQSDAPVLIQAETGCEQDFLAQCIHNGGPRKNMPYVVVECGSSGMDSLLASARRDTPEHGAAFSGLTTMGHGGTVYFNNVEKLSGEDQHLLLRLITDKVLLSDSSAGALPLDVRVIASSGGDLPLLIEQGLFQQDLYFSLNTLGLRLPPLRERPDDTAYYVDGSIQEFMKKYDRYIVLDTRSRQKILRYGWPGNRTQLRSFCERLVLTAPRRNVDDQFVEELLAQMYPSDSAPAAADAAILPEPAQITALLEKHQGNRKLVADELGISTTTLWRRMKKHHLARH